METAIIAAVAAIAGYFIGKSRSKPVLVPVATSTKCEHQPCECKYVAPPVPEVFIVDYTQASPEPRLDKHNPGCSAYQAYKAGL